MPILWRYLLKQFFKVFVLTTVSFISILFITRLKDIARVLAVTPDYKYVFFFMLNIIPFILPIAIPIACLLSVVLLYQKLSLSHEFTAMRCSGFSLFTLTFPVLAASAVLALANFFIVSELTTHSQLFSQNLMNELITTNPFYILEHKNRLKLRDSYVDMIIEERGRSASNLFFISPDRSDRHLNLISIKKLEMDGDRLFAPSVNIITSIPSKDSSDYDHLVIENEKNLKTSSTDLSKLIKNSHFHLKTQHCSMPFLLISIQKMKEKLKKAITENNTGEIQNLKIKLSKEYSEIVKRISIGLSAFTFTLLGTSYAIEIGRNRKRRNFIILATLAVASLLCLFTGKIFERNFLIASLIYLVPHLTIVCASFWELSKVARGIE